MEHTLHRYELHGRNPPAAAESDVDVHQAVAQLTFARRPQTPPVSTVPTVPTTIVMTPGQGTSTVSFPNLPANQSLLGMSGVEAMLETSDATTGTEADIDVDGHLEPVIEEDPPAPT